MHTRAASLALCSKCATGKRSFLKRARHAMLPQTGRVLLSGSHTDDRQTAEKICRQWALPHTGLSLASGCAARWQTRSTTTCPSGLHQPCQLLFILLFFSFCRSWTLTPLHSLASLRKKEWIKSSGKIIQQTFLCEHNYHIFIIKLYKTNEVMNFFWISLVCFFIWLQNISYL